MKKSCEIIGLTVVSIQEGKELGTVNQLVIDAAAGRVAALLIDDGKWYLGAKALPFSAISGLGEYAVTINTEADIMSVTPSSTFDNLLFQNANVVGALALTRVGNISGTVAEIVIDADGKIVECLIEEAGETRSLSAQRVITYGKDVLIISAENELQPVRLETVSSAPSPVFDALTPISEETVQNLEVDQEPVEPAQETDDLAKMFEEKQRKYLLGKTSSRRIEAESGVVVIEQGEEITEAVLQKAKLAGKFVELSMSIS
ncbi:photosystem reaction center subunit H [Anaerosporomusa subterranea]|jgi:uncharacterized protein YrrD|uniref:Photosystem reaction center subunit H n=1 Tax=Anaerosporomusa subterranea TaxID=1794912 RepID=A0A154BT85_ANASB|nr:PRC-barrel domain-containing protein [Anaerosporomusa subterranea]KYZ77186.1 photosystem reaction center subunit H [Anaerosporomusa subterranea]MDF2499906.1 PRC-barrel domain protein [Anaerosporomusa subterranea]